MRNLKGGSFHRGKCACAYVPNGTAPTTTPGNILNTPLLMRCVSRAHSTFCEVLRTNLRQAEAAPLILVVRSVDPRDPRLHRFSDPGSVALQRPPPKGAHCGDVRALRRHRRGCVFVVTERRGDTTSVGHDAGGRAYSRGLDGAGSTFVWLSWSEPIGIGRGHRDDRGDGSPTDVPPLPSGAHGQWSAASGDRPAWDVAQHRQAGGDQRV
jgi:hypothetical protein